MPQENISFSQQFKANATSPPLPEIYIYRTAILQRTLTFSGLINFPTPVHVLDVCVRGHLSVEPKPPFYTVQACR
jgi:hypothetical protein